MKLRLPHRLFILILSFLSVFFAKAQQATLVIQLNKERLQLDDRLDISGLYTLGDKQLPPTTLALVIKENNGDGIWQLRWPMINGHAEASLFLPPNIRKGNYTLYFAVEPRSFQAFGHVLNPPGITTISAFFYSPNNITAQTFNLPVDKKGFFKLDGFQFENSAILELNVEQEEKMPAISMDAWLDSTFEPAAAISKEITIGLGEKSIFENKKIDNWLTLFDPFYQTSVLGNLPALQKFDSIYVSKHFKNPQQQFDCLGDSELVKSKSLVAFLAKHFDGFEINDDLYDDQVPRAHAKGYHFIFYLNEQVTTFAALNNIKLSDIALIKIVAPGAYPISPYKNPNFGIVLYTKRGPFCDQDYYRYKYIINGYQPTVYQMPPSPKMFATDPYNLL